MAGETDTRAQSARWRVRTGWRSLALLLALALGMLPWTPAAASEQPRQETAAGIREETPWETGAVGMGLWFWPEEHRGYQLDTTDFSVLRSYDVRTRDEVARTKLQPQAWSKYAGHGEFTAGSGRHHVATVDRENGRIFVAYKAAVLPDGGVAAVPGHVASSWDQFCFAGGQLADPGCVGGIHVLDATTLQPLANIEMTPPTTEGQRLQLVPRALEYVPAQPEMGWPGKVLMVVEEIGTGPTENSLLPALLGATQNAVPRRSQGNITYAVQFDVDTGRQEWMVRLEACRNSREGRGWLQAGEGHPTTIFRRGGERPSMYVGCHANTQQQGVVVRVPLDGEGRPATTPVTVRLPDAQAGPPDPADVVILAPRQETYSGPDSVTVMLSDPKSERLLMRVDDAGEVWWVFDARVNQFIGTVGIGDYRHGHTTYGLDPDVGRLYVLAAEAKDATGPGGLYVADIRRNPVPQALHYPEFADPPRTGVGLVTGGGSTDVGRTMSVLSRGPGGLARLYQTVHRTEGSLLRVIADSSPIASNADPLEPSVRSLDLLEVPGVTAATFDGTARGFGFRALLLGGVEGAARVGPADPLGTVRGAQDMDGYTYEAKLDPVSYDPWQQLRGPRETANSTPAGDVVPELTGSPVVTPGASLGRQGLRPTGDLITSTLPPDPCSDTQRELILAFVGPRGSAVVDASSARGEAQPLVMDTRTSGDVQAPAGRCLPWDWQQLWQTAMFGSAPVEEPGIAWPYDRSRVSCTDTDGDASDAWSDPVMGAFSSQVDCSSEQVGGWGQARGAQLDDLSIAHTLSSFRIYRDPGRGIVSRVESMARGIRLGGVVDIDTIRGSAESWANGRTAPAVEEEAPGDEAHNPFNCDVSRPAGTCFRRQVFGVTVRDADGATAYRCGPCGPEDDFIDAMNRAFGAYGYARFREPDAELARGSDDGYIAAITKTDPERFADVILNSDLLETIVPMLEVVRFAPHNRQESTNIPEYSFGTPPRGRQIYQFAAVEVSSSYGIQCLLVFDEATNTCADATQPSGALAIELRDPEQRPLAGGAFEVRHDTDEDGVLGLVDTLLDGGTCVTAEDGTGTCRLEGLEPGPYLVSQAAAPPGHSIVTEPWATQVVEGETRTVTFTNGSDMATVEVTATREDGAPLAGAAFAVHPDPDGDGRIAADSTPSATCVTDAEGRCTMRVPAGAHVLVQTATSDGLLAMDPVPFVFASGGQVADVQVVNVQHDAPPGAVSAPVAYREQAGTRPTETVTVAEPPPDMPQAPEVSLPGAIGGTIVQVIRAPGDALRLLSRSPVEALAWSGVLALLALAVAAVRRRELLMALAVAAPATPAVTRHPIPPGPRPTQPGASRSRPGPRSTRPSAPPSGAAPAVGESTVARVVVATASASLTPVLTARLEAADRCELTAVVSTMEALRAAVREYQPSVLVLDLALPTGGPEDVCDLLAELHEPTHTVGLIPPGRSRIALAQRGRAVGLGGILAAFEDLGNGNLAYAVRCVAEGKPCHGPTVQAVLLSPGPAGPRASRRRAAEELTRRELEIALLAARGGSRTQIAQELFLSPDTVKRHLRAVRAKLGVTNPRDAGQLRRRLAERLRQTPRGD